MLKNTLTKMRGLKVSDLKKFMPLRRPTKEKYIIMKPRDVLKLSIVALTNKMFSGMRLEIRTISWGRLYIKKEEIIDFIVKKMLSRGRKKYG